MFIGSKQSISFFTFRTSSWMSIAVSFLYKILMGRHQCVDDGRELSHNIIGLLTSSEYPIAMAQMIEEINLSR